MMAGSSRVRRSSSLTVEWCRPSRRAISLPLATTPLSSSCCSPLVFLGQSEIEVWELFHTVLDRWDVAEGFVGALVVVAVQPVGGHGAHLLQ